MIRFLYYKGYIDMLKDEDLIVLKQDIINDYNKGIIEPHQYEFLINKLIKKLKSTHMYVI